MNKYTKKKIEGKKSKKFKKKNLPIFLKDLLLIKKFLIEFSEQAVYCKLESFKQESLIYQFILEK